MSKTAQINHRTTIRQGRVFDITLENVTLPNGYIAELEIIRHPGASAIVAMTADGSVLMLKQYRHAIGKYVWEIPAGTFDGAEDPLVCARRELEEETGYHARQWAPLLAITPVPGYSDEKIHIFLATELFEGRQHLDQDEVLEVHPLPLAQVVSMITSGEIQDAKTIAGVLLADQLFRQT